MTAKEYNWLIDNAKANLLWANGILADERVVYSKYTIQIYSLYDFFVEVYYNVEDNRIEDIYALEKDEDWRGFLNTIKLSELLSEQP